jgi:UDP-N-acetylglucosamine acyltransferase
MTTPLQANEKDTPPVPQIQPHCQLQTHSTALQDAGRQGSDHASACPSIHPSAIVDKGARLGQGVTIGPFCIVGPHVILDDGVHLHSHVVVDGWTHIGQDVEVFPFSTIGVAAQHLKCPNEETHVEIGPRTTIREHVTIHRGTSIDQGLTRIGADCLLMVGCHVAHDCLVGDHVVMANQAILAGHVHLADHVYLGGVVAMALGHHGNLTGLNIKKLRHLGLTQQEMHGLRQAYQWLFLSQEGTFQQRIQDLDPKLLEHPSVQDLHRFLTTPQRKGRICMPDPTSPVG